MAKDALKIHANTFQYFSRNPRGGNAKALDQDDISRFLLQAKANDIHPFLAHAPYTLNGCSADPALRDFAKRTMADDLARLESTPGNLYNFHPGSHVKQGTDVGISYIADMLNEILKPDQTTTVLLETMSGKGSEVGKSFEELKESKEILERLLGHPVDYLAYPFGRQSSISHKVMKQAEKAGYKCAFGTIDATINDLSSKSLYYLPRIVRK